MTVLQVKDYALRNLPSTVSGVHELFLNDLGRYVILDKIVGMDIKSFGYSTLVFYFYYRSQVTASTLPVRRYLLWWFRNKLGGVVNLLTLHSELDQVWWVRLDTEVKEDRK